MGYTTETNNQIVIGLLKYHKISKVIVSPGANNVSFVASIQTDPFFEIYSCVDERSAAYMACGIAAETGEPVVLSCTGATASRNYLPGLTEAYYRHLPVLAITSTMPIVRIGHNVPQCIDRNNVINDVAKLSVHIPLIKDDEDEWICNLRANEAILELRHGLYGPVHINLETNQGGSFNAKILTGINPIDRIRINDKFILPEGKIAIFVGSHLKWNDELINVVDEFCEKYNSVVICDHTSNYKGKYPYLAAVTSMQEKFYSDNLKNMILIHIGDTSGSYIKLNPKEVWRVSADGRLCDYFHKLRYVFEMDEFIFFEKMNSLIDNIDKKMNYYCLCEEEYKNLINIIPDLPFSNMWIAQFMTKKIPERSVLHLGILNSLRSWNLFEISKTIMVYSNTGGFGIDGCISSMLGASIVNSDLLYFGVVGDLAFFYDMNSMGNRHCGANMRIMVINNGCGQEFKNYGHRASQFGDETDSFIAAARHFGNKSNRLLKNYCVNLGFEYMSANDKNEFISCIDKFTSKNKTEKSIVFEVFTNTIDETYATKIICNLAVSPSASVKKVIKNVLGDKGVNTLKKILKG